jgi:hypothetical protein
MSKTAYKCPACQNEVDRNSRICSRSTCRAELAYCSYCYDVVTFKLHAPRGRRLERDYYRCTGCEQVVLLCRKRLVGANCNGLTRTGRFWDHQFCAACQGEIIDFGKKAALTVVATLLTTRLTRPRP